MTDRKVSQDKMVNLASPVWTELLAPRVTAAWTDSQEPRALEDSQDHEETKETVAGRD